MQRTKAHILMIFLLTPVISPDALAQELRTVMSLGGKWKFMVGDDSRWAKPGFQDSDWDEVRVPGPWEDQGYPGYNGYAWYRLHFMMDEDAKEKQLYLRVGYVDDVSEVYLNGHLVGFEGRFPPEFITAYQIARAYILPQQYINYAGENLIAVRVYDYTLAGGITHGSVGIYEPKNPLEPDYNLAGVWKFRTGDDPSWAQQDIPDEQWDELDAPGYWETQKFRNYDGFAWYRKEFEVPRDVATKELVLLVGKIDDFDETYLNGKLIGHTGRMRKNWTSKDWGDEYSRLRAYSIPAGLIVPGQVNTVAVRVLDVYMHGGIYDGPLGLVERSKLREWQKGNRGWKEFFEWFR